MVHRIWINVVTAKQLLIVGQYTKDGQGVRTNCDNVKVLIYTPFIYCINKK